MAASDQDATQGEVIMDMEFPVEEDVDACLTHFVLLSRFDHPSAVEAAQRLADEALWRHISFFPIFAELGTFFVSTNNLLAVQEMVLDYAAVGSFFEGNDQLEFVQVLALFSRGRLEMATLRGLRQSLSGETFGALPVLSLPPYDESTIKRHVIELCLRSALLVEPEYDLQLKLGEFMKENLRALVKTDLIREAVQAYFMNCIFLIKHPKILSQELTPPVEVYLHLHHRVEADLSTTSTMDDIKSSLLTSLQLSCTLLIAVRSPNPLYSSELLEPLKEQLETIDQKIDNLSSNLCSMLGLESPSENYMTYLTREWKLRSELKSPNGSVAPVSASTEGQDALIGPHNAVRMGNTQSGVLLTKSSGFLHVDSHDGNIYLQDVYGKVLLDKPRGDTWIRMCEGHLTADHPASSTSIRFAEGPISIDDPKMETIIRCPKSQVTVDRPQAATYVYHPGGQVSVDRPEAATYIDRPSGHVTVDRPEAATYIDRPSGHVTVDRPEAATYVDHPSGYVTVDYPKDTTYIDRPSGYVTVDRPEAATYIDHPSGQVTIDCPEDATYIDNPKGSVWTRDSEGHTEILSPKQTVRINLAESQIFISEAKQDIEIWKCLGTTRAREPRGNVSIHNAAGEVHVLEPLRKTEIIRSRELVHIYEPEEDIHIYNILKGKNIVVHRSPDESMPQVLNVTAEPCPPYAFGHQMPYIGDIPSIQRLASDFEHRSSLGKILHADETEFKASIPLKEVRNIDQYPNRDDDPQHAQFRPSNVLNIGDDPSKASEITYKNTIDILLAQRDTPKTFGPDIQVGPNVTARVIERLR